MISLCALPYGTATGKSGGYHPRTHCRATHLEQRSAQLRCHRHCSRLGYSKFTSVKSFRRSLSLAVSASLNGG